MGQYLSAFFQSSNEDFETFTLLWLDANINQSEENVEVQDRLTETIHQVKPFENPTDCEEYIRKKSEQDRIVLITSGQLGRTIVPRIHHLEQLLSIYVYCGNKDINEKWSAQYSKVIFEIFL